MNANEKTTAWKPLGNIPGYEQRVKDGHLETRQVPVDRDPYPIWWPEVPVMYAECDTLEKKLKQRIRRAVEKTHDHGFAVDDALMIEICTLVYDKVLDIPEIKTMVDPNLPKTRYE